MLSNLKTCPQKVPSTLCLVLLLFSYIKTQIAANLKGGWHLLKVMSVLTET